MGKDFQGMVNQFDVLSFLPLTRRKTQEPLYFSVRRAVITTTFCSTDDKNSIEFGFQYDGNRVLCTLIRTMNKYERFPRLDLVRDLVRKKLLFN